MKIHKGTEVVINSKTWKERFKNHTLKTVKQMREACKTPALSSLKDNWKEQRSTEVLQLKEEMTVQLRNEKP